MLRLFRNRKKCNSSLYANDPVEYKHLFIENIYKPGKYISVSARHAGKLQGFPADFKYHDNEGIAKAHFGNAVPVVVVEYVAKELLDKLSFRVAILPKEIEV